MANSFLLVLVLGIVSTLASDSALVNFYYGFSMGYGLDDQCRSDLDDIDGYWIDYIETDRDGSGAALTKLRDFTLYLTVVATDCSMLEIANLLDNAYTTNALATILRFIASFEEISTNWNLFWSSLFTYDYPLAGEALGVVVKKLVG